MADKTGIRGIVKFYENKIDEADRDYPHHSRDEILIQVSITDLIRLTGIIRAYHRIRYGREL